MLAVIVIKIKMIKILTLLQSTIRWMTLTLQQLKDKTQYKIPWIAFHRLKDKTQSKIPWITSHHLKDKKQMSKKIHYNL